MTLLTQLCAFNLFLGVVVLVCLIALRDHERRIKWLEWDDKIRTEMERADREEGFLP